jgi:SH3-like domain-containing protein
MPYLLERHEVRDYDRWREVFDAEGRKAAGC